MRVLSASNIERAIKCEGSTVLGTVGGDNENAKRGTGIHLYTSLAIYKGEEDRALSMVGEEYRDECKRLNLDQLRERLPGKLESETPFVFNTQDGSVCRVNNPGHRNYGDLALDNIAATLDLYSIDQDRLHIVELKTGNQVVAAVNNWQLRTQAFMVARFHNIDEITASIAYLNTDGSWRFDDTTFDAIDIDSFAADLQQLAERRVKAFDRREKTGDVDVVEGDWCKYCPCMNTCPAKTALVKSMQLEMEELSIESIKKSVRSLTNVAAGDAWQKLVKYGTLVEAMKKALEDRARVEPIPLPNGKQLAEVEVSREYVNGSKAFPVLVRILGREKTDQCMTISTSKSAIQKIASKVEMKDITKELRDAGAVVEKTYKQVKETDGR